MDASEAPKMETLQDIVDQFDLLIKHGHQDTLGDNYALRRLREMAADQGGHYKPQIWDTVNIEYNDGMDGDRFVQITSVMPDFIYARLGPNHIPFQVFNHHIKSIKPVLTQQLTHQVASFKERLAEVRRAHEVQGNDGNWNFDPYMTGLYNGLEFALATMEGRDPKFRSQGESKTTSKLFDFDVWDEWDIKPGGTE